MLWEMRLESCTLVDLPSQHQDDQDDCDPRAGFASLLIPLLGNHPVVS